MKDAKKQKQGEKKKRKKATAVIKSEQQENLQKNPQTVGEHLSVSMADLKNTCNV